MATPEEFHLDAQTLRVMRKARGIHQHQLAAQLDINQGRISEWETGVKPIPADRVEQLWKLLH